MKQQVQDEKRCDKCNAITQHKEEDFFCDFCEKRIDRQRKYYHLSAVAHGAIGGINHEDEPVFDTWACALDWLVSPKYVEFMQTQKPTNAFSHSSIQKKKIWMSCADA